jgi:hypothetical protein
MWHSTKRWFDWAMRDFWLMHRMGPRPQTLHYRYEKAGLTVRDQPIPWSADIVIVEATLRIPQGVMRRKADFQAIVHASAPIMADDLIHLGDDRYLLSFRIPPPPKTTAVSMRWRNRRLAELALPVLTREQFIAQLRLELPTLFVRLGDQNVACRTYVASQCRGLLAGCLLTSPTSLLPLLDIGLEVDFQCEHGDGGFSVRAQLSSSQLADRQALVSVAPRRLPRRLGAWTATWKAGERVLTTQWMRAISRRRFYHSLRVFDARFVAESKDGSIRVVRQAPPLDGSCRVGPCFLVHSKETGMAGRCPFTIRVHGGADEAPRLLAEQEALIMDGPSAIAPAPLDASELSQVTAFELRLRERSLATVSLSPIPSATFTAEGGFRQAADFTWSGAAEEELTERLNRLLSDERESDS